MSESIYITPPRSPFSWVLCVPSYILTSPMFKGVNRGMSFKHTSPFLCFPWYMQVRLGAWSKPINLDVAALFFIFNHFFDTQIHHFLQKRK